MRAKTINEVQNFERGAPAKAALGIGGIVLGKKLWDRKLEYIKEWKNFIEKSFLHKTIYGFFGKWLNRDGVPHFDSWNKYKVYVEGITIRDGSEKEGLPTELMVKGKDGFFYQVPVDDKEIYILDDES